MLKDILFFKGDCMSKYLFIALFIIIIASRQVIENKRKNKAIAQSIKSFHGLQIFSSLLWFILAFFYLKRFFKYRITNISISIMFDSLYITILYTLVGITWVFRGFKKDIIHEYGIFTGNGNYKWNKVISYKWGIREYRKIRKDNIEYHKLTFRISRNKVDKWFCGVEYKEIILEIDTEDKERVNTYLKQIISEIK